MTAELQTILSELKTRLTDLYGERLEQLILFGSQARGDAEPDSDIDVLVVLKGAARGGEEIRRTSKIRRELSLKYNVVVSCTYISAARYHSDDEPLLINARREGVAL